MVEQNSAPKKTIKNTSKITAYLKRVDWLFVTGIVFAIVQSLLLFLLNQERNSYTLLKQEDTDRIHVIQKATTITQEEIEQLEGFFLKQEGVIAFIQAFEATKSGFDTAELRFISDIPEGEEMKYLPFVITLTGEKTRLLDYNEMLLASTYPIELTKFEIEDIVEDRARGTLTITANLYISKEFE